MLPLKPTRYINIVCLGLLGLCVLSPTAQGADQADDKSIISFTLENDIFVDEDDGYTNGVRFSYFSAETDVPDWLDNLASQVPFFASQGNKRYGFAFGQTMFAPDDLTQKQLITDDRPYAGFAYGSAGLISDTGQILDNFQITIGMVGPTSLAGQTQDFVHDTIGSIDPQGWDNQLENEPGLIISYDRRWRNLYEFSPFGWAIDATPHLGASLGNIHTYASAGATFRVGYDLPSDYGPPLIQPSMTGSDFFEPSQNIAWYTFAGFEGRAVARNIFLDGNSFTDSHSVEKKPFVGSIQAGLAMTYKDVRLSYTHVFRTKEFDAQQNADEYGAVTLSIRL